MKKKIVFLHIPLWTALLCLLGTWKLAVFATIKLGLEIIPRQKLYSSYFEPFISRLPFVWHAMSNFDGQQYLAIASMGYLPFTQAYFPLYPLLIRLLAHPLHIPYIIAALIISHFCFWFALYMVYRLFLLDLPSLKNRLQPSAMYLLLLIIIFFPTSQFYGAVYNDALFFFLATTTLFLGRSQKWFWAGVFGGLATLARLNGLALWPFLVFEVLLTQRVSVDLAHWRQSIHKLFDKKIVPPLLASLLIPLAFVSYLLFHQLAFGSWQVVFANMQVWHQDKVTFPPQVIWRYIKILLTLPFTTYQYWVAFLELFFVLFYVVCLAYSWRRIRFSYWIFFAVSILIPWLTGSFQGMPRYGLHLYPFFLTVTLMLYSAPKWLKVSYFLISLVLFVFYTVLFTRGYFVA